MIQDSVASGKARGAEQVPNLDIYPEVVHDQPIGLS